VQGADLGFGALANATLADLKRGRVPLPTQRRGDLVAAEAGGEQLVDQAAGRPVVGPGAHWARHQETVLSG
jgi:hypothetical protein